MRIEADGQGPALVLIHGWAMHGGLFAPLAQRLRERHRLFLVDLPGHGASRDTPWSGLDATVAAISAQVPRDALWLGWSLGGLVALRAALDRHARGLVMLCATPRFTAAEDWPEGVDPAVFTGFARELVSDFAATIDRFLALEAMGSDHLRADLRHLRAHVFDHGEPAPAALQAGLDLLLSCDLRAALPDLVVPSLWIAGRRDRLVTAAAMRRAAGLAPQGRFLQIEGGGHAPFLSHADAVADAIQGFVASGAAA